MYLYPVWNYREDSSHNFRPLEQVHTVSYDGGEAGGGFKDPNRYLNYADAIVQAPYIDDKYLGGITPPEGKHFQGWYLSDDPTKELHRPGTVISVDRDLKFIAQWGEKEMVSLRLFERRPGTDYSSSTEEKLRDNGTFVLPSPTKVGYKFNGWTEKADGTGRKFNAGQMIMVTEEPNPPNILYGNWERIANAVSYTHLTLPTILLV